MHVFLGYGSHLKDCILFLNVNNACAQLYRYKAYLVLLRGGGYR
jgi:hypothetical protein